MCSHLSQSTPLSNNQYLTFLFCFSGTRDALFSVGCTTSSFFIVSFRACSVTCKIEFAVIDHVWQVAKHLGLSSGIQSETKILRTLSSHQLPYDQHTSWFLSASSRQPTQAASSTITFSSSTASDNFSYNGKDSCSCWESWYFLFRFLSWYQILEQSMTLSLRYSYYSPYQDKLSLILWSRLMMSCLSPIMTSYAYQPIADTVAQTTVPMFACFSLKSKTPNRI